jgi:hypothetical protein
MEKILFLIKDHEFNAKVRNILMQPKEKIVLYIYAMYRGI